MRLRQQFGENRFGHHELTLFRLIRRKRQRRQLFRHWDDGGATVAGFKRPNGIDDVLLRDEAFEWPPCVGISGSFRESRVQDPAMRGDSLGRSSFRLVARLAARRGGSERLKLSYQHEVRLTRYESDLHRRPSKVSRARRFKRTSTWIGPGIESPPAWLANCFSEWRRRPIQCAFVVLARVSTNGSAIAGMDKICQRASVRAALRRLHISMNQSTWFSSDGLGHDAAGSRLGVLTLQYASAASNNASSSFEHSTWTKPHRTMEAPITRRVDEPIRARLPSLCAPLGERAGGGHQRLQIRDHFASLHHPNRAQHHQKPR